MPETNTTPLRHDKKTRQQLLRLLKFVSGAGSKGCRVCDETGNGLARLKYQSRQLAIPQDLLADAVARGLVSDPTAPRLTGPGRSALVRLLHPEEGFREQHLETRLSTTTINQQKVSVRITDRESPLSWLRHGGGRKGSIAIGETEFEAGERLRRDFEKAGLGPSITSNWSLAGTGGRSGASAPGGPINDLALDAKQRFNTAISCLPPELRDVAVDVCCFLKRLEEVEFERKWPRRSARLMLKTALSALARHYGYDQHESIYEHSRRNG